MITTILTFALIAGVIGFVAYPLFRSKPRQERELGEQTRVELLAQKQETYQAIKELEFDRAMGKISSEDFQELNQVYKAQAASILQALDQSPASSPQKEKEKDRQGP